MHSDDIDYPASDLLSAFHRRHRASLRCGDRTCGGCEGCGYIEPEDVEPFDE